MREAPMDRLLIFLAVYGIWLCAIKGFGDQPEPVAPEATVALFKMEPGVRIELVAAEPDVIDPVAMAFDEAGRLFVVENRGYPDGPGPGKPPAGVIALLEDADGDGRYERRGDFATGFDFPNGIMPWKGGVFVTCAPDLIYLRDNDGDGRADERRVVLTGFSLGGSTQLRVSHPTLAIDNWIYLASGLSGGDIRSPDHPEMDVVRMGRFDLRYNPLTGAFEKTAGQAQFGLAFDDFGRKFVCSNRKHIEHVVLQPSDLARNPYLESSASVAEVPDHGAAARVFALSEARTTAFVHAGTFTAACGLHIYGGTALPSQYRGNSFVCEPTANLIHRDVLKPDGATFIARRGAPEREFLATSDDWFRPVFITSGPDGALYLCDMYRRTIEHPTYLPPGVAEVTDFGSGGSRGRIYRITGAGPEPARREPETFSDDESIEALGSALADSNAWTRETAHRLLLERSAAASKAMLIDKAETDSSPLARVHALHLIGALRGLNDSDLSRALTDPSPRVREQALRLARTRMTADSTFFSQILELADDGDPRVRFLCALALGDARSGNRLDAMARIALRDHADPWTRDAILSGLGSGGAEFATMLVSGLGSNARSSPAFADMLQRLGGIIGRGEKADAVLQFVDVVLSRRSEDEFLWRAGALRGLARGMGRNSEFSAMTGSPASRLREAAAGSVAGDGKSLVVDGIDALFDESAATAGDPRRSALERSEAALLLGITDYDRAIIALEPLLAPRTSGDLQLAAVRALAAIRDDRVASTLLNSEHWRSFRPESRVAALTALTTSNQRVRALLSAVQHGDVQEWTVDAATRARLNSHSDSGIRAQALDAFPPAEETDRKKVYARLLPLLDLEPDAEAGGEIFRANCAQCHVFRGEGHDLGPDLSDIRSHPPESILMHVLIPNWVVVAGYENYLIETTAGESLSGLIKAESEAGITLRRALGEETFVPRGEINSVYSLDLSLMPEELERELTRQNLRDLIGFLKGEEVP